MCQALYESSSLFWRSSSTSDRPLSHLAFDRILHCPNPSLPSFASTRVTTLRNEPPPFDPSATHRVGPDWLDSYFARGMPDVPSSTEMLLFCQSSILMLERSTPQKWSSRRYEKADLIGELKISFECRKVETRRIGWRIEVYDPISLACSPARFPSCLDLSPLLPSHARSLRPNIIGAQRRVFPCCNAEMPRFLPLQ